MEPIHYLRALRHWWAVILALTVVGFVAAYFVAGPPKPTYASTHTLIEDATSPDTVSLARVAFLTTNGEVPKRVAAKLGTSAASLSDSVDAVAVPDLNGVQITAHEPSAARAIKVADAMATEVVALLDSEVSASYQQNLKDANAQVDKAREALLAGGPDASQVLVDQYTQAVTRLGILQQQAPHAGYSTIGTTTASVDSTPSRAARTGLGGLTGLMLGLAVALVLAWFDTRIHTREAAEATMEYPVVAEIPRLRRRLRRRRLLITAADPESLAAEAFRGLRTVLLVGDPSQKEVAGTAGPNEIERGGPRPAIDAPTKRGRVILVVSPGVGEGKTTTAANLAVAFAESGRSVLMLGCDLRRPELHRYFALSESPGLTDTLTDGTDRPSLDAVIRATDVPNVRVATSGSPVENPGELLNRGRHLIASARERADIVVIDTPPLLATDDASPLMTLADDLLIVCRAGKTPMEAARRARELLLRLHAPVVGVVLVDAQPPGARSYYRSAYKPRRRARNARPKRRGKRPEEAAPTPGAPPTSDDSDVAAAPPVAPVGDSPVDPVAGSSISWNPTDIATGHTNGSSLGAAADSNGAATTPSPVGDEQPGLRWTPGTD